MPDKKSISKAEQREATTQKLMAIGRDVFTRRGYAQTATEEIVQLAGVTRGALYHHFSSKEGLFKAIVEEVQKEVAQKIEEASAQTDDLWEQLLGGCRAFLTASLDPQVQQIMLIDGPAVLGWEAWREMDARHSLTLLKEVLGLLAEESLIAPPSVDALAHLLSGAMNEAALWIARAEQPEKALSEAVSTLEQVLNALKVSDAQH